MNDPTIREFAEELVNIGTGLSNGHPIGGKISDLARGILHALDNSQPQCLDNPPHCSHRLVPDPHPNEGE